MKTYMTMLAILAALTLGVGFYFFTGSYDVAATSPHWNMTLEILAAVRDQSIKRHSEDIKVHQLLDDPKLRETGFPHYHAMCRLCHGAPGYEPKEFAKGLYPNPPHLASGNIQDEWNDAQLYWIVKNGLRMTGMPSFGITHSEDQMWGVVAFLRLLPDLQPDEYRKMVETEAKEAEQKDHHHGGDAASADNH